MKKIIITIMLLITIFLIYNTKTVKEIPNTNIKTQKAKTEDKGVFISYIDYADLNGKTKEEQQKQITKMINNISYFGLNKIILQISPFSDAIYPSKIYESSHTVVQSEGDPLELDILKYFIDKAKDKNIDIYAWLNPYRIRNTNDTKTISKNTYYYKWLNTDNIQITNQGIYLNPASKEVLTYIEKGLQELCQNYDIKGVLYDDYYYPNDTIDLNTYKQTNKETNLKTYRINNINKLIETSYNIIKQTNKNIKFGLSPAGNIENNKDKEYLDIESILKTDKIDFIIPQLYYGFENSTKPYIKTLKEWTGINTNNKDFYVALALYKSGKIDNFAGRGENEWLEQTNIIKKQIITARNEKNYKGFYIYRYEYLFNIYHNNNLTKEIKNIKNLIDKN